MSSATTRKLLPVGERFGFLVVLENLLMPGETLARAQCACGVTVVRSARRIRLGITRSCGCQRGGAREFMLERGRTSRAIVLSHIGMLTPRLPHQIQALVVDDMGSMTLRNVHRHLAGLLTAGEIVRTPDGYVLARRKPAARSHEGLAA